MGPHEDMTEIIDMETESEILQDRLIARVARVSARALNQGLTVGDDMEVIVAMVVAGVLHHLRVMSSRQLAVLLASEANRHEGWVIHEPPQYSAEEIDR